MSGTGLCTQETVVEMDRFSMSSKRSEYKRSQRSPWRRCRVSCLSTKQRIFKVLPRTAELPAHNHPSQPLPALKRLDPTLAWLLAAWGPVPRIDLQPPYKCLPQKRSTSDRPFIEHLCNRAYHCAYGSLTTPRCPSRGPRAIPLKCNREGQSLCLPSQCPGG